jgi:ATP-dependent phosphofructokinase / diphosphate-dependent phosphofructokinase
MADTALGKLGIVVGGGPAPGINGVISSVTIEAVNQGLEVVGIRDGFKHLVNNDITHVRALTIPDVAPFYQKGGSLLGTSRTNPAKDPAHMANVLEGLNRLGVKYLVTIGGDDTAFSGSNVHSNARGAISVAHVPKTIDNDLPLPAGIPTFGFETARHYGVQLARNLHEDAKTTTRWYVVVSMGRAAGHLALGIGKASAATVTIIAEEFQGKEASLELICDIIIGSMIKRKAQGKGYGLAVLAEGLMEKIGEQNLRAVMARNPGKFGDIELDAFGHLRLGEIEFGRMVRTFLASRLKELGLKFDMIDKDLGYELRCADPIPFDAEYTRNLGYGAVKFLLSPQADHYGVVITFVGGTMVPRPFQEMIDPATKKMRPRLVDMAGENYEVARRYMIRLERSDFEDPARLEKLAAVVKMSAAQFSDRFAYVVR